MKPLGTLVLLFALLGCEKKALSDEDRARNAVIEWIELHGEDRIKSHFHSAEVVHKVRDGVMVLVRTGPADHPRVEDPFFVRTKDGSMEVSSMVVGDRRFPPGHTPPAK